LMMTTISVVWARREGGTHTRTNKERHFFGRRL
jgi:hypothetical protein